MKKLLLASFILTVNVTFADCGNDTIENVNLCTVDTRLYELLKTVRPAFDNILYDDYFAADPCVPQDEVICERTCEIINELEICTKIDMGCEDKQQIICPPWNPSFETYTFAKDICVPTELAPCPPWPDTYEHLIIDPLLPLNELQAALDAWKDQETTRLDYWNRLSDIEYLRESMVACNLNQPNSAIFVRDLKLSLDETKLTCLESYQVELKAISDAAKVKDNEKKAARELLKNWDCSGEIGLLKVLCEAR